MSEHDVILTSGDGSHTVLSTIFADVAYHSRHGAITESNVVFIDAGLNFHLHKGLKRIRVFEMGFGTGLNALLSYIWSENNSINIDYQTVEAYPIEESVVYKLNYCEILGNKTIFESLHMQAWGEKHIVSENFSFKKHFSLVEDVVIDGQVDVIFYDAFAPSNQPHLWEIPILKRMYDALSDGGILVSYCAQGAFKRNLKSCGFAIESIPGPPGKREMTRAIKMKESNKLA